MRDQENNLSFFRFPAKGIQNPVLGDFIQSAGGFVKNEHAFVGKKSAGQSDPLFLAVGKISSVFQQNGRVAVLSGFYKGGGIGKAGGTQNIRCSLFYGDCSAQYILSDGHME